MFVEYMSEEVRQSTGSQSVNADKTNNLVGNFVRKPIQMNTASIYGHYQIKETCNDFSKASKDETKQKGDLGFDI